MQLHTQDVVDIRLRSWSVADPEDRASGEEGLEAVPPAGVQSQRPRWGSGGEVPPESGVLVLIHSV